MWYEFIGDAFSVLGMVLIALTAIAVHDTVRREHRVTKATGHTLHKEHVLGFLGIACVIIGYTLSQIGKYSS